MLAYLQEVKDLIYIWVLPWVFAKLLPLAGPLGAVHRVSDCLRLVTWSSGSTPTIALLNSLLCYPIREQGLGNPERARVGRGPAQRTGRIKILKFGKFVFKSFWMEMILRQNIPGMAHAPCAAPLSATATSRTCRQASTCREWFNVIFDIRQNLAIGECKDKVGVKEYLTNWMNIMTAPQISI